MRMFMVIRALVFSAMFLVASGGYAQNSQRDTLRNIVCHEDTTYYSEIISYDDIVFSKETPYYTQIISYEDIVPHMDIVFSKDTIYNSDILSYKEIVFSEDTTFYSEILSYEDIVSDKQAALYDEIAFYADKVREQWMIPGLSVSIIKDDSLVFARGFGVREKGSLIPVTENTVYHIGSITKSYTSWLMASLVEDKLLSWNRKVKDILPDFDLYDDYMENNLLVKDLMTHATGLRGQAGTYIPNLGYNRDDIYQMLKYIKPMNGFRERFAYNNITFIIAAKIIETVSGKSWEENIQERIFNSLDMSSSTISGDAYLAEGINASVAHSCSRTSKGVRVRPIYGEDRALHWCSVIAPAGGINSTVVDLAKWAKLHLHIASGEEPKGYQFLHKGHTIVRQDASMVRLYGQCWYVEKNKEYRMYYHTGTTWGFTAICAFIPELDLGISILCNSEVSASPRFAIVRHIVDLYLGKTGDELNDRSARDLAKWLEYKPKWRATKSRGQTSKSPTPARMVGRYIKDQPFGNAIVSLENDKLYLTIGPLGWKHELKKISGNKFYIISDGHAFPIIFHMKKRGRVISMEVDFNYNENFGVWKKR